MDVVLVFCIAFTWGLVLVRSQIASMYCSGTEKLKIKASLHSDIVEKNIEYLNLSKSIASTKFGRS